MTVEEIMSYLPHRYPMLMVDRILEIEPGKRCKGLKNVTINEDFFNGHFPGAPIMPGVLIIESMAQAGAALLLSSPESANRIPMIVSVENARFKRPVKPGDQLIADVELVWFRNSMGKFKAVGTVDGLECATLELTFKLAERGEGA